MSHRTVGRGVRKSAVEGRGEGSQRVIERKIESKGEDEVEMQLKKGYLET